MAWHCLLLKPRKTLAQGKDTPKASPVPLCPSQSSNRAQRVAVKAEDYLNGQESRPKDG